MSLRFRISSLTSNIGDAVDVPGTGVTCVVGGNNAGKSQLLRDINQYLQSADSSRFVVLRDLSEEREGSAEEAETWLDQIAARHEGVPGSPITYSSTTGNSQIRLSDFRHFWNTQPSNALRTATPFFCWHATAGSLVNFATTTVGSGVRGNSTHPLSELVRYGELEEELSNLARDTFGLPLVLDRLSGEVRLRVGDPGVEVPPLNRPTRVYADAVSALPALEHQGDGMKAFIGLALSVVAGTTQVLLVDEPEAFLHPAQARALGRWLATEAHRRDKQVILATHDRDLVLGLLDADAPVKMIRVKRSGDNTTLRDLAENELSAVWSDPVLKYSNVLQGLFHERVVICEADADCRFYSAVLDTLATETGSRAVADGTLFVPAAGKQRAPVLARALSSLGVDAYAFPDFDILRAKADVKGLLEALGGEWTDAINDLYMQVVRSIPNKESWDDVKNRGLAGLKSGPVYNAGQQLLDTLAASGLKIVPVGEMEDYDKSIGLHGSAWVTSMLASNGHVNCSGAREFVAPLAARP